MRRARDGEEGRCSVRERPDKNEKKKSGVCIRSSVFQHNYTPNWIKVCDLSNVDLKAECAFRDPLYR